MGRPIKSKYFGTVKGSGIGGEGISSTITVVSTGSDYSLGSVAVFSAPQVPTGTTATGDLTISAPGAGGITAVTLTSPGSGYSATATISITTASSVTKVSTGTNGESTIAVANTSGIFVGMTVTGDIALGASNAPKVIAIGTNEVTVSAAHDDSFTGVTLTFADLGSGFAAQTTLLSAVSDVIQCTAYIPAANGGSSAVTGDIQEQVASRKYRVLTAQGTGPCRLVTTSSLAVGQMFIGATDSNGSTYFVKKLTARRAVLVQRTMNGSFEFNTNEAAGWTLDEASTGVVKIDNR